MPEICLVCARDMIEIYLGYAWDTPETLRHIFDMPEICMRYAWDIPEISLILSWDMPEICLRYPWDYQKRLLVSYWSNCSQIDQEKACHLSVNSNLSITVMMKKLALYAWIDSEGPLKSKVGHFQKHLLASYQSNCSHSDEEKTCQWSVNLTLSVMAILKENVVL